MSNASAAPRAAAATTDDIEAAPTLDSLPPEVLGVAFGFLQPLDMMPLTECSRQWRDTDVDNVYWKPLFLKDFGRPTREIEEWHGTFGWAWQQRYYSYYLDLQDRVRVVLAELRRVRARSVQSLPASRRLAWKILRNMALGHPAYFEVATPETDSFIFETTFTRIQDIGPRRQKQYVRAHFLHELSNWDAANEQELYVPLLFVELLKRRGNHDEQFNLLLRTLEKTIRAKFRQAKEERERKAREKEESVMTQASCSRSSAAKALRTNHGNIVKAIMELTM